MHNRLKARRRVLTLSIALASIALFFMSGAISCGGSSGGGFGGNTVSLGSADGNCVFCHVGITIIHDRFQLGCVDCHGGDKDAQINPGDIRDPNEIVKAHVVPENPELWRANALTGFDANGVPEDRGNFYDPEFFDDVDLPTNNAGVAGQDIGIDFDLDGNINDFDGAPPERSNANGNERDDIGGEHVDSEYNEDLNYVRWLNPSDLRVAQASCGRLSPRNDFVGQCHQQEVDAVRGTVMVTVGGVLSGAYYQNRVLPAVSPIDGAAVDDADRRLVFGYQLDFATIDANFDQADESWPANSFANKAPEGRFEDFLGRLPLDADGDGFPDTLDTVKTTFEHGAFGADAPLGSIQTHRIRGVGGNPIREIFQAVDAVETFPDRVVAEGNAPLAATLSLVITGDPALIANELQTNLGPQNNTGDGQDLTVNAADSVVRGFRPFYNMLVPRNGRDFFGLKVKDTTIFDFLANNTPFELIGQNNPIGMYSNSGCASCHVLYARDGISREPTDKTIAENGRQPSSDFPFGFRDDLGQGGHPVEHFLTTQIPSEQCGICHIFVTRVDLVFEGQSEVETGYDQDQETQPVQFDTPDGTTVNIFDQLAHFDFDGNQQVVLNDGEGEDEDLNNNGELDAGEDANNNGLLDRPTRTKRSDSVDGRQLPFVYGGHNGSIKLQDIHVERGMECIDCHFIQDNHGDGNIYGRNWDTIEIECDDCHGTSTQRATLVTSGANGGNDLTEAFSKPISNRTQFGTPFFERLSDGTIIQRSRVFDGRAFIVPQIIDAVDANNVARFNPDAFEAMAVESDSFPGVNAHIRELGQQVGGNGGLECYSCHNAFSMNCFSCHYNMRIKNVDLVNPAASDRQRGTFVDTKLRPGFSEFQVFAFVRAPLTLAVNGDNDFNKISTFRSLMQAHISVSIDADVLQLTANDFVDVSGLGLAINDDTIVHNLMSPTPNALSGQAFNMFMPHTVRTEETKDCEMCHTLVDSAVPNDPNANVLNNHILSSTFSLGTGRYNKLFDWIFVGTDAEVQLFDTKREIQGQAHKVWPGFVGLFGSGMSDGAGPRLFNANGAVLADQFPDQPAPRVATFATGAAVIDSALVRNLTVPNQDQIKALDTLFTLDATGELQAVLVAGRDNTLAPPLDMESFVGFAGGGQILAIDMAGPDQSIGIPNPDTQAGPNIFCALNDGNLGIVEASQSDFPAAIGGTGVTYRERGSVDIVDGAGVVVDVAFAGNVCYALVQDDGDLEVRIVDVSDVDAPVDITDDVNSTNEILVETPRTIEVYGFNLYVLSDSGLDVFSTDHAGLITRETAVTFVAGLVTPDFRKFDFVGNKAVIAGGPEGVHILDITVTQNPILLRTLDELTGPFQNFGTNLGVQNTITTSFTASGNGTAEANTVVVSVEPGNAGNYGVFVGVDNGNGTGRVVVFDLTDFRDWRQRIVDFEELNLGGNPDAVADDDIFATNHRFSLERRDPLTKRSPFTNQAGQAGINGFLDLEASSVGNNPNPNLNANLFLRSGPTIFIGQTVYTFGFDQGGASNLGPVFSIAPPMVLDRVGTETGNQIRDGLDLNARTLSLAEMARMRAVRVVEDGGTDDESGNGLGNLEEVR